MTMSCAAQIESIATRGWGKTFSEAGPSRIGASFVGCLNWPGLQRIWWTQIFSQMGIHRKESYEH